MGMPWTIWYMQWSPSPHGEGGLKSALTGSLAGRARSLPTRGGWIEIRCNHKLTEWKECPSPHGEGGLKWRSVYYIGTQAKVPPHTGRVE